jgi:hypothetical protein
MGKFPHRNTTPAQHDLWLRLEEIVTGHGIVLRCADCQAFRRFLGYSLTEETPDHSTYTILVCRLLFEAIEALRAEVLRSLREHAPLRGWKLGIDSSVIEANASLSGLERRNSEKTYRECVRGLAAAKVEAIHGEDHDAGSSRVLELAADKGHHDATELAVIRHETGMRTVIPNPSRGRRRMGKFAKEVRVALRAAQRAVASPSGWALLRAQGTHLERGLAHVLECGRLRRTYLRGRGKIAKRYHCGIIAFNFTLLMRKLFGTGTPRQMAAAGRAFFAIMRRFLAMALRPPAPGRRAGSDFPWLSSGALTTRLIPAIWLEGSISTGA